MVSATGRDQFVSLLSLFHGQKTVGAPGTVAAGIHIAPLLIKIQGVHRGGQPDAVRVLAPLIRLQHLKKLSAQAPADGLRQQEGGDDLALQLPGDDNRAGAHDGAALRHHIGVAVGGDLCHRLRRIAVVKPLNLPLGTVVGVDLQQRPAQEAGKSVLVAGLVPSDLRHITPTGNPPAPDRGCAWSGSPRSTHRRRPPAAGPGSPPEWRSRCTAPDPPAGRGSW